MLLLKEETTATTGASAVLLPSACWMDGKHIVPYIRFAVKILGDKLGVFPYLLETDAHTSNVANCLCWRKYFAGGGYTHSAIIWIQYMFGFR